MESAAKDPTSPLAEHAYLLDHPLRARIAAEPDPSYREPTELARTLGEPLPRVAYHCRVLATAGWKTGRADS
jgi:hypothetical protein